MCRSIEKRVREGAPCSEPPSTSSCLRDEGEPRCSHKGAQFAYEPDPIQNSIGRNYAVERVAPYQGRRRAGALVGLLGRDEHGAQPLRAQPLDTAARHAMCAHHGEHGASPSSASK